MFGLFGPNISSIFCEKLLSPNFGLHLPLVDMPIKKLADGPVCENPQPVVDAWNALPLVTERLGCGKRLVLDIKGKDLVLPTRENMVYNAPILLEIAKDMHLRGRCGADPIDCLALMTVAFYERKDVYKKLNPTANVKTIAYNQAWVLHKMISRIRNSLPKHQTTRELWLAY